MPSNQCQYPSAPSNHWWSRMEPAAAAAAASLWSYVREGDNIIVDENGERHSFLKAKTAGCVTL